METLALPDKGRHSALVDCLRERDITGAVFSSGRAVLMATQELSFGLFPAVCLGPFTSNTPIRHVTHGDLNDAATAFEYIWAKGYRRIGLIVGSTPISALYRAGFIHARAQCNRASVVPALELSQHHSKAVAWLQRHRPDALLFEHPELWHAMAEHAQPPVGIAMLDVTPETPQKFAGMRRNTAEVGRLAVRMLAAQINEAGSGNTSPFCHVLVESEWVEGPSLPMRL